MKQKKNPYKNKIVMGRIGGGMSSSNKCKIAQEIKTKFPVKQTVK